MSSNDITHRVQLDELFPAPTLPPSRLSPQRFPGADLESLSALQDVLKDNHLRHHIFYNESEFHNHITHRALAIYALGGSAAIIRHYYKLDSEFQWPVIDPPGPITEENVVDHVGDQKYYQSYIQFFSKQISEKGAACTLEEFVFSKKYNFREGRDASAQPEMLARLFAGLLHPLIHVGHGAEFGLRGMLAEGLALTAVHTLRIKETLSPSLFTHSVNNGIELVSNRISSLALDTPAVASTLVSKTSGVHAFDVVAAMIKDDRLKGRGHADFDNYAKALAECNSIVQEHTEKWTVDLNQPGEIERKLEEVVWLSSLVYSVGGLTSDGFKANFFAMHFVTSSLFLPSLIAYLSPQSQVLLLRGYLHSVLTLWTLRGQLSLNIKSFIATTSLQPSVAITPTPGTPLSTETTPIPNPFLPILQSVITHPNDHMTKIQRAFAHFNTIYGRRPVGYFSGTALEDAELLDGTLFLRAALLTADFVGWVREGKEHTPFTRSAP